MNPPTTPAPAPTATKPRRWIKTRDIIFQVSSPAGEKLCLKHHSAEEASLHARRIFGFENCTHQVIDADGRVTFHEPREDVPAPPSEEISQSVKEPSQHPTNEGKSARSASCANEPGLVAGSDLKAPPPADTVGEKQFPPAVAPQPSKAAELAKHERIIRQLKTALSSSEAPFTIRLDRQDAEVALQELERLAGVEAMLDDAEDAFERIRILADVPPGGSQPAEYYVSILKQRAVKAEAFLKDAHAARERAESERDRLIDENKRYFEVLEQANARANDNAVKLAATERLLSDVTQERDRLQKIVSETR